MLKVSDVASRLNISASKVYQLVEEGKLSHHRFDGAIRFSEEQIAEYLEGTKKERQTSERLTPLRSLKHLKF